MHYTINSLIDRAVNRFNDEGVFYGHGSLDAEEEASFLVIRGLGLPFGEALDFDRPLSDEEASHILGLIERRAVDKIPAAYLLHEAWLGGFRFYCDERTLVPRSYISELLPEALSLWIGDYSGVRDILDLCTGSACLAILAKKYFPQASVTASDISRDALDVAKINVHDYGMEQDIELVESDLFDNLNGRTFDLIISNPPYVTAKAMRDLPEEYRKEPELGLEAGEDGLDIVRRILRSAPAYLNDNGFLLVEVGDGKEVLEKAFPKTPFIWLATQTEEDMVFLLPKKDLPKC